MVLNIGIHCLSYLQSLYTTNLLRENVFFFFFFLVPDGLACSGMPTSAGVGFAVMVVITTDDFRAT